MQTKKSAQWREKRTIIKSMDGWVGASKVGCCAARAGGAAAGWPGQGTHQARLEPAEDLSAAAGRGDGGRRHRDGAQPQCLPQVLSIPQPSQAPKPAASSGALHALHIRDTMPAKSGTKSCRHFRRHCTLCSVRNSKKSSQKRQQNIGKLDRLLAQNRVWVKPAVVWGCRLPVLLNHHSCTSIMIHCYCRSAPNSLLVQPCRVCLVCSRPKVLVAYTEQCRWYVCEATGCDVLMDNVSEWQEQCDGATVAVSLCNQLSGWINIRLSTGDNKCLWLESSWDSTCTSLRVILRSKECHISLRFNNENVSISGTCHVVMLEHDVHNPWYLHYEHRHRSKRSGYS